MKYLFPKGSTSVIVPVFIQDSSSTTGAGLGGLDQTSSIVGGYVRPGGTGVALAVDQNVTTEGTYEAPTTAGQVRIGTPANMRTGTYELHLHNDLLAAGADAVLITLGGATNMADLVIEIQLTDVDVNDGVRAGMTALPNAAADANNGLVTGDGSVTFTAGVGNRPSVDTTAVSGDTAAADNLESACDNYSVTRGLTGTALPAAVADAAGGVPVSDAGGLDLDTKLANTNEVTAARMGALTDWINGGRLDLLLDAIKVVTDALPDAGALNDLATILADTADMQPKVLANLASGTAQSGTASTIVLAAASAFVDNLLNGNVIKITGGTGAGQARVITSNTLADDTCNVTPNWTTNPSSDSVYEIVDGSVSVDAWRRVALAVPSIGGVPEVDITHVSGDSPAATNLSLDYDGTGYNKANSTIGTCTANSDMVGTDSAALASVCTEARLSELDAATGGKMANQVDVIAVDVAGLDGNAMVGTDSAALASVCTEARLAELAAANLPADIDDIQTRLPATLVGGRMDSDVEAVNNSTAAADQLALSAATIVNGAAEAGTLSTTQMSTDLTEVTNDHYNGRVIIWTSGVLQNQATDITDYVGVNGVLTFTAVTEAPSAADTFIIV